MDEFEKRKRWKEMKETRRTELRVGELIEIIRN